MSQVQDDNSPATKKELRELSERVDRLRDDLIEKMRDMQTELLRAFSGWARPVEIKLRTLPMIEERLGLLEERVGHIERGELPPQPH
jgi:DNA-binding ferritin-like protein (Dps family)